MTNKRCTYRICISNARRRGISWDLTYVQWCSIWTKSGHWSERGCKRGQYVMARFGDVGSYAVNNVKICLCSENLRDANLGRKLSESHKLALRGRIVSDETRQKIGDATRGRKHKWSKQAKKNVASAAKLRLSNGVGAKIHPREASEIFSRRAADESYADIAKTYDVTPSCVFYFCKRNE